jgi:hypothetical protein
MRETPDRYKTVFALLVVGALVVMLVGGLVGIVKRGMVSTETSHVTDMINQLLFDGYIKELRNTVAPITPAMEQRVHGFVEKEF